MPRMRTYSWSRWQDQEQHVRLGVSDGLWFLITIIGPFSSGTTGSSPLATGGGTSPVFWHIGKRKWSLQYHPCMVLPPTGQLEEVVGADSGIRFNIDLMVTHIWDSSFYSMLILLLQKHFDTSRNPSAWDYIFKTKLPKMLGNYKLWLDTMYYEKKLEDWHRFD